MKNYYGSLHHKLWEACNCYEWRMEKQSRLSSQRREDIIYIRQLIQLVVDDNLLEREIKAYLATLATGKDYLFFPRKQSVLKDMLLMVLQEEKSARIFQQQPLFVTTHEPDTPLLLENA